MRRPTRTEAGRGHPGRRTDWLAEANLLELTPVREADWKVVDGWVVLERPPPSRRGLRGVGERLTYHMAPRRIRLDDVGSLSWSCFDGDTTVADACAALRDRFGENVEPVEERLGQFVRYLYRDGFLSYREE